MLRILLLLSLLAACSFGAQSVTVLSGTPVVVLPAGPPWNAIGASSQPMRWEMRLHGFDLAASAFGPYTPSVGVRWRSGGRISAEVSFKADSIADNSAYIPSISWTDVLVRIQRNVADNQYTFEVCDVTGQEGCRYATSAITAFGQSPSWSGLTLSLGEPGYSIDFLRWFSAVVPVGTPIPVYGVAGDIANWEFEGSLTDSTAGLRFTAASVSYAASPTYKPWCNPGAQQSFRAGYPAQLDGSHSQALDGGTTLTHLWQQLPGVSPDNVIWLSPQSAPKPRIDGLTFGSYNFQLTVVDGSGQSSTCVVEDGAVATDDNGVVTTENAAVTTLLGPMIQFGRNPWPWMDNRNKHVADVQAANIDKYYVDFWDGAQAAGTLSLTARQSVVVGVGTNFKGDICDEDGAPMLINGVGVFIILRWNGGANRRMVVASSCADDTHLTLASFAGAPVLTESGVTYSLVLPPASPIFVWQYGGNAQYPANYYDNVAAFYALYYRTGFSKYLTYARTLADRFWSSPMMDEGWSAAMDQNSGFGYNSRMWSPMGLVLRALDGRPEMWPGLRRIRDNAAYTLPVMQGPNFNPPGLYDQRGQGYMLLTLSLCALFDPDSTQRAGAKALVASSLATVWTPVLNAFPDYSWSQFSDLGNTSIATAKYVSLVNGASTVRLNGGTWAGSDFATNKQAWFFTCSGMGTAGKLPSSNAAGDGTFYRLDYLDSTHATLLDPVSGAAVSYAGASGDKCYQYVAGSLGWRSQPFMVGIVGAAFDLAAQAMYDENFDHTSGALFYEYAHGTARWLATSAYRASTKGLYYFVASANCPAGAISEEAVWCQAGGSASNPQADRILNAEAVRALMFNWLHYSRDPSVAKVVDEMVNAQWAKPGTCPPDSTVCVPDGYYLREYDDTGVWVSGAPPGNANPKWFGMAFGLNPQPSWPAMKIGRSAQPRIIRKHIGFNLESVSGAAGVRVVATAPSGRSTEVSCAASPCAIDLDASLGGHLLRLKYVSPANKVLAVSGMAVSSPE
jgi:hypothetical protein